MAETGVTGAFLPVVAPPGTAGLARQDGPYGSEEEFLYAIAEALREEYTMILDAGLLLQVDDAFLPWMYDVTVPPSTLAEYRSWAKLRIDVLNHAQVDAGADLIELANPCHEHEWRLWRDVALPTGTTLVPGVISHATNVVEHPETNCAPSPRAQRWPAGGALRPAAGQARSARRSSAPGRPGR